MKMFLTLQLVSLIILIVAWCRDTSYWLDIQCEDFTVYYKISRKIRNQTKIMSCLAGVLSVAGALILIWSY